MLTWRVEMCDFNLKKVPLAGRRFRFKAALAAIEPPSQPASQALEAPAARATREWAYWLLKRASAWCARRGCAPDFSCLAHDGAPEFMKPAHTGTISAEPSSLGMQQQGLRAEG